MKEGIMMFSRFDIPTRQILIGNLLFIGCCIFYIIWWILAFRPVNPIKGTKSGWLLLPAFILGVIAVVMIVQSKSGDQLLFSNNVMIVGSIVLYVVLAALTRMLMHRPITTELILIVGWLALMFKEVNTLYSLNYYSRILSIVLLIVCIVMCIISLACYVMYYDLDVVKGYIDGMIPLIIVIAMMLVVNASIMISLS
ncbi:MAG: hypothetical protein LUG46_04995 [Erysipelotrichaceae bacterium]|nr:hypothetical protein [Erysipelotrichaceae bacterium]